MLDHLKIVVQTKYSLKNSYQTLIEDSNEQLYSCRLCGSDIPTTRNTSGISEKKFHGFHLKRVSKYSNSMILSGQQGGKCMF